MCTIGRCTIERNGRILHLKMPDIDPTELQRRFGATVTALRRARGWSQEQFALRTNIDRRYMSDIERGKRNVSLGVIERIAAELGMTVYQLFLAVEAGAAPAD